MARRPRIDLPRYHHVVNRGVNRTNIFFTRSTAPAVECTSDSNQQNKPHITHKML
jgi:hypothetical protein